MLGSTPLGWAYRVRDYRIARWGIVAGWIGLTLTVGWWLRFGARPRNSADAIGVAIAAGLLAAWVCNLFVTPMFTAIRDVKLYPLRSDDAPVSRLIPGKEMHFDPHPDIEYLDRFVPPDKREREKPINNDVREAYEKAHTGLVQANQLYRSSVGVWASQFFTLFLFLATGLMSGWAADYLVRSGRGLVPRGFCYAELFLPTMGLLFVVAVTLFVIVVRTAVYYKNEENLPPLSPFAGFVAATAAMTAIAFTGVIRRWHPAIRIGGYLVCLGLIARLVAAHV